MPFVSFKNGRIFSTKIEFNLVDHCNFSCDECSHSSPFMKSHNHSLDQFKADLSRLASVYRVQRFRFVGGEPLLHKSIVDFVRAVKESNVADTIEVVSNGVLLDKVSDKLFQEIDSLSVSWYPDQRFGDDILDRAKEKCAEFDTRFRVSRIKEFRRMQVSRPLAGDELVSSVFRTCLIAHTWNCQTFYAGFFYLCSRPLYTQEFQQRIGNQTEDLRRVDGIALHEPDLQARILIAMRQEHALASCKYCLGTVGKHKAWRQMSLDERREPRLPNAQPEEDIDVFRMRGILFWRAIEGRLLRLWPSVRFSRALNLFITGILRH